MKKSERIPIFKQIWCRVRYFQQLHDISDETLAHTLGVHVRTLREYDRYAGNIALGKLDSFLYVNNLTLNELLNL